MSPRILSATVLLSFSLGAGALEATFQRGFHLPGHSAGVSAIVLHDDGAGPRLFAGALGAVDGQVGGVFAWDGTQWTEVAGPAGGVSGQVTALAVFDGGGGPALWALGRLFNAGGQPAALAARWNGAQWTVPEDLASPPATGSVDCATVFDDGTGAALYAGGRFTVGGADVFGVLRWTGTQWLQVGGSFAGSDVTELAVFDPGGGERLYAMGRFTAVGAMAANGIAAWDGSAWSALAGPSGNGFTNGFAEGLTVFDAGDGAKLYAAGVGRAGGLVTSGLAAWDGSAWSVPAVELSVTAAAAHDFGGGEVLVLGHTPSEVENAVSAWDGQQVTALPSSAFNDRLSGFFSSPAGGELVALGFFEQVSGIAVNKLALWTGAQWRAMSDGSGHGLDFQPAALEVFDDGGGAALYVGGNFDAAGAEPIDGLARWTAQGWQDVEDGAGRKLLGWVSALKSFDDGGGPRLVISGFFTLGGDIGPLRLAAWDGTDWTALQDSDDVFGNIYAMEVFDGGAGPELFIGGTFSEFAGVAASSLVRFDGATFSLLPGEGSDDGVDDTVEALEVHGGHLWVGGRFARAGSLPSLAGLARWDGAAWSALPVKLIGHDFTEARVFGLESHDAGDGAGAQLYVAGAFARTESETTPLFNVARWHGDTGAFEPLGAGVRNPGTDSGYAQRLLSFDAGNGPSLYAMGPFTHAGSVESPNLARWDGARWHSVGGPVAAGFDSLEALSARPAMMPFDDGERGLGLFFAGVFSFAGGVPSDRFAFYRFEPEVFSDGFEGGDLAAWSETVGGN